MYQKPLKLAELGFSSLDSFLQCLETHCREFSFRLVGDEDYVITLNSASSDGVDSESVSKKNGSGPVSFVVYRRF